jgi:hypothetical protein
LTFRYAGALEQLMMMDRLRASEYCTLVTEHQGFTVGVGLEASAEKAFVPL